MHTRYLIGAYLVLLLGACTPAPSPAPASRSPQSRATTTSNDAMADEESILARMHATWDQPGKALDAGPVVVAGDWAVADWDQGAMGGRALLRRGHDGWTTVLCAGDLLRSADGLQEAGVPSDIASTLATKLAVAERGLSAERLGRMSAFMGIVRMQEDGHGQPH